MASADYTVLTPERVSLEYGIAGIGSRGGAAIVDTCIQVVALVVLSVGLAGAAAAMSGFLSELSGNARLGVIIGVFFLGLFAISSGYFMLFEIVWSGQTPGKRLLGLRVIRESGYPLRPVDAVIRNVVRIVDWLPLGYGIGVLVMLVNNRSKRLGDFVAGTLVVREGARRTISSFTTAPQQSSGYALAAEDATLVRDFLMRRDSMHADSRLQLAQRLATVISQRYALPGDEDPERFLEGLTG